MTKDEAIEVLKHCGSESHCIDYKHRNCGGCNQRKAQDMAVEVLQTEAIPVDAIRQLYNAALEYRDRFNPYSDKWLVANDQAIGVRSVLDLYE